MSIDDGFRKLLDGVKAAAWARRTDLDAQLGGLRETLTDMRETIAGLKTVVVEQSRTIDALRQRLDHEEPPT